VSRRLLFAANWKMNLGPGEAREYAARFQLRFTPRPDRETWFFPPAVSLEATAAAFRNREHTVVGAQDIHWEPKGAFTGAISGGLARAAGAAAVLIGHSERRQLFGETDADTNRKLRAALRESLMPVLCVGETLAEREGGQTEAVVRRQVLAAIEGIAPAALARFVVAYEPVWAIGTGKNAAPTDAAEVHRRLRAVLREHGVSAARILYGGSVNQGNAAHLLAEEEVDGVLVGGASLDPEGWATICGV
jgi:triosephosphate isomerase